MEQSYKMKSSYEFTIVTVVIMVGAGVVKRLYGIVIYKSMGFVSVFEWKIFPSSKLFFKEVEHMFARSKCILETQARAGRIMKVDVVCI